MSSENRTNKNKSKYVNVIDYLQIELTCLLLIILQSSNNTLPPINTSSTKQATSTMVDPDKKKMLLQVLMERGSDVVFPPSAVLLQL